MFAYMEAVLKKIIIRLIWLVKSVEYSPLQFTSLWSIPVTSYQLVTDFPLHSHPKL